MITPVDIAIKMNELLRELKVDPIVGMVATEAFAAAQIVAMANQSGKDPIEGLSIFMAHVALMI